jgi:hypothetical protein
MAISSERSVQGGDDVAVDLDVERIQRPASARREHCPAFFLIEFAKPPHSANLLSEDRLTRLSFI